MAKTGDRREDRLSKPPTKRFISFTLLNTPIDQVLMQIKDKGDMTFPGKLKRDPSKRSETNTAVSNAITAITHPNAMT